MKYNSIWLDKLNETPNEPLKQNEEVDVIIIGGGITGISTAYHLMNSNLKVCLVEKNLIGHGVTARTTGKLTYLQELIYSKLNTSFFEEDVKLYLNSQKEAIEIVKKIIEENNIDCDFMKCKSFVFTNNKSKIKKIEGEQKILESFNIKVKESKELPNGKKCKKAIYVDDTAVFHPIKYLNSLKRILNEKIDIYENTKINTVNKKGNIYICKTDNYKIEAKKVVFAVHYPYFLFPYFLPMRTHLEKSYIAASKIPKIFKFSAITSEKPTISIRYHKDISNYEIYLTNSHNLCLKNNDALNFNKLLKSINKKPSYLWSNKDIITSDNLPYIGLIKDNLYLATGYNTWGMTNGTIAGKIIADLILDNKNKYINLFDPHRILNVSKIINFPINLASNVKSYIGSKINKNKSWYKNNVEFKKVDGDDIAIYIDEKDKKHIVYNKCPHMKCGLIFNELEKTWDCPCHGSRFDIDGKCIEGPSNYDITYKKSK